MLKLVKSEQGITIVEVIIIVVVIGIFAGVAIPIYNANFENLRASEAEATLNAIRTSLKIYRAERSFYPVAKEFINITDIDGIGLDYVSCSPYRIPIARLAAAQAALKDKIHRRRAASF